MPRRRNRPSPVEPALPRLRATAIDAMQSFIQAEYGSRRTPSTAAPLLCLIVELHRHNMSFPTRARVKRHLGLDSPFGIDCAIRTAIERELITEQIEIHQRKLPGDTLNKHALSRRRFIPSDVIIDVVEDSARTRASRAAAYTPREPIAA